MVLAENKRCQCFNKNLDSLGTKLQCKNKRTTNKNHIFRTYCYRHQTCGEGNETSKSTEIYPQTPERKGTSVAAFVKSKRPYSSSDEPFSKSQSPSSELSSKLQNLQLQLDKLTSAYNKLSQFNDLDMNLTPSLYSAALTN